MQTINDADDKNYLFLLVAFYQGYINSSGEWIYFNERNSLQTEQKMEHFFQSVAMDNAEIYLLFAVDM